MIVFYLAATCVSCFFSSHRFVKLFGVLALLSYIAAYLAYVMAVTSVWCFFAAILSVLIYLHLRFRNFGGFQRDLRAAYSITGAFLVAIGIISGSVLQRGNIGRSDERI